NVDRRGRGTLPEEVRRELGLDDEDSNLVLLEKTAQGTYELVPARLVPRDQLWFHYPEMQRRIEGAEADFAAGRSEHTDTPEQAQELLDRLKG
ncbi:MAG TPA: AbrB/MazE/SpoVT family DNA-binding domain-containing protein, partial [Longimicrobiaceae bacterium]|nr:AbrB/MazE/SpoVT family DNA-binding domain-containing protein [Longimicrobiaceae bacterium]